VVLLYVCANFGFEIAGIAGAVAILVLFGCAEAILVRATKPVRPWVPPVPGKYPRRFPHAGLQAGICGPKISPERFSRPWRSAGRTDARVIEIECAVDRGR
jgi:hypothetical protein